MKKKIIIKESELRKIVREAVEEELGNKPVLDETSRRQKAEKAIKGTNKNVRTFAILTPENPMGKSWTPEQNKEARKEFERVLKVGNFRWFPIKGKYDNRENSYIIYNIPLDDALRLGNEYHQESIIYAIPDSETNTVHSEYWERDGDGKPLKLKVSKDSYVDATNAEDLWSQISRKFKFRFPFFEQVKKVSEGLNERREVYGDDYVDNRLARLTDGVCYTGYSKYCARGMLYGPLSDLYSSNER